MLRHEPIGPTITDLLVLTAGTAAGITFWRPSLPGVGLLFFAPLSDGLLALLFGLWFWVVATLAMALVIAIRRVQYRTFPAPAEWFTLVIAAWGLTMQAPNVDTTIHCLWRTLAIDGQHDAWRRGVGMAALVITAASLVAAIHNRDRAATSTFFAIVGCGSWFWGVQPVLDQQLPRMLDLSTWLTPESWQFQLADILLHLIAAAPVYLLVGTLLAGTWSRIWRVRGQMRWTEWFGILSQCACLLVLTWWLGADWDAANPSSVLERMAILLALVPVALVARLLARRFFGSGGRREQAISC